ncbi:MAG: HIT family protein [Pyrinomonadaceae bacterium]
METTIVNSDPLCIFCQIVARESEASVLYEDDRIIAFMNLRPINPGEFMVIPKSHVDHFCDLPDELSCHILIHAQRLSRNLRQRLNPQRVGLVVHGYGVAHAHLVVVPQHGPDDITSAKLARIEDGRVEFDVGLLPQATREELNQMAKLLS